MLGSFLYPVDIFFSGGNAMNSLLFFMSFFCMGFVWSTVPGDEIELPKPKLKGATSVEEALQRRRSVRNYRKGPLSLQGISQLLWAAQGITKRPEGYRTAPSAGATYPLVVYLVAGDVTGLQAGVYRYNPETNSLIKTVSGDVRTRLSRASLGQPWMREAPATLAIAALYERTASRYGQRAKRYVHIEVGHVGQNIYLEAESIGLATVAVGAFDDGEVKKVLGLQGKEVPLYLMPVGKR